MLCRVAKGWDSLFSFVADGIGKKAEGLGKIMHLQGMEIGFCFLPFPGLWLELNAPLCAELCQLAVPSRQRTDFRSELCISSLFIHICGCVWVTQVFLVPRQC